MPLSIIRYPSPILRKKCVPVKNPTDPEIQQLILDMIKALRANKGVGLAAPQIGKDIQLAVIEIDHEIFVLINPEIKSYSGKEVIMEEGCLSFPGKFFPVKRYEKVKVKAFDTNGKKQILRAKGLLARVLQHEIDHLHGALFVDRVVADVE